MDLRKCGTGYHPVDLQEPVEQEEHIELTVLPKSGTPSYSASARQSQHAEDDDRAALVDHAQPPSGPKSIAQRLAPWIQSKRGPLQGWRFGVICSAWLAASVLVINTLTTIAAVAKFGSENGIGTAYTGSCSRANSITTCLHILINALSSVLLSASNYTMQALVAPTRAEVDSAHSNGDWTNIGVASVRNLFKIKWYRSVLWTTLALSSVPIHLLYNSAVFKSIDANEYMAMAANTAWLEGEKFSLFVPWVDNSDIDYGFVGGLGAYNDLDYGFNFTAFSTGNGLNLWDIQRLFHNNLHNTSLVSNLSVSECISTYGSDFVSGRGHVVAITNDKGNFANETLFFASWTTLSGITVSPADPPYGWICAANYTSWRLTLGNYDTPPVPGSCEPSSVDNLMDWRINGKKIDYCLSQLQPQRCTVQFSVHILIVVICMNAMKSLIMFVTVYWQTDCTLVTIGDAISSFLERPDEYTTGSCLMSRRDLATWRLDGSIPTAYRHNKGSRWFAAASKARWMACSVLIAATITASGSLIGMGAATIRYNGGSPWSLGWGTIDTHALMHTEYLLPYGSAGSLIVIVLLANCPQALVSFVYLFYNSLLTSLLLAKEWSTYASKRKGVRVSTRKGAHQRSTYYLHLPLRYSVPLLVASATLHWIISQSIFLAQIDVYSDGQKDPSVPDITNIGFSLPPILTAMIIGFLMSAFATGLGFQRLGNMPVAGSCSLAISAACHRPADDVDAALLPVQWGAVQGTKDGIGHACFTSQPVTPLVPGRMYA